MMASMSESTKFGIFVHLLDVLIKVGKYFPIISLSLASLNLFLVLNDFFTNNIVFGILHSLFAIGGFIFVIQMRQMTKANPQEIDSGINIIKRTSSVRIRELN